MKEIDKHQLDSLNSFSFLYFDHQSSATAFFFLLFLTSRPSMCFSQWGKGETFTLEFISFLSSSQEKNFLPLSYETFLPLLSPSFFLSFTCIFNAKDLKWWPTSWAKQPLIQKRHFGANSYTLISTSHLINLLSFLFYQPSFPLSFFVLFFVFFPISNTGELLHF